MTGRSPGDTISIRRDYDDTQTMQESQDAEEMAGEVRRSVTVFLAFDDMMSVAGHVLAPPQASRPAPKALNFNRLAPSSPSSSPRGTLVDGGTAE